MTDLGTVREGVVAIINWSMDPLCLRCSEDVEDAEIPYHTTHMQNGTEYVLCFDCSPAEWQAEIIEFEQGLDEDERYLPSFLLD